MFDGFRRTLLRLLKVPPEPALPAGRSVRVFRAAPEYFRYHLALWAFGQLGAIGGLVAGLFGISYALSYVENSLVRFILHATEAFAWVSFLILLPSTLAIVRLDFELRWYILSDRSLRIREGILTVKEKTMTFANIQQISIHQNPIQRLLGIADVHVRTAGGGGGGESGQMGESAHEAYVRGVRNAEEIRTAIQERVRLHRDGGLGDPDDPEPLPLPAAPSAPVDAPALAAARNVLREARELRIALTAPPAASAGADTEGDQGVSERM